MRHLNKATLTLTCALNLLICGLSLTSCYPTAEKKAQIAHLLLRQRTFQCDFLSYHMALIRGE